jgi:alpha-galactosidase
MKLRLLLGSTIWLSSQFAMAVSPSPDEMAEARRWAAAHFESPAAGQPAQPFFAFTYDGKAAAELLKTSERKQTEKKLDPQRTQRTLLWTDPKTGLEVRCTAVEYADFPVVEWTVFLRNTGKTDTPIIENIQALNARWERPDGGEFVLRGIKGDFCAPDSYEPYETVLGPNAAQKFAPWGGRPTNGLFPYYSLTMPGGGVMLAVGWPGQWATSFARDAGKALQITAGQELTHLRLKPGEEIRTPLVVLLFWKGNDVARSQNLWRRWMLAHNLPRPGGKPLRPMYEYCSGGFFEGLKVSEASEKLFLDVLGKERIHLDYWWMDAGWYPCDPEGWIRTGTWEVDAKRFPKGIRAVSDYAHAKGVKLIVWFEPERVVANTWLANNHPEWLLGGTLLNLGDPRARLWLTNHVDKILTEQGIDLYRQDFNMDPLAYWRKNDPPDRQGITENLHVQGYLAYWDELLRRHPGMLIDSCASGGRRNDLETLRRAVPLLRSDYQSFTGEAHYAAGNQGHTYGLSSWIPFYGQGVYDNPQLEYYVRSHMCPSFSICLDVRKAGLNWDRYRRLVDQWRKVADYFLGDYYPLMPYSLGEDRWIAWQFDCPERGEGVVQAFRRVQSPYESIRVKLRGLEPGAVYVLTNLDLAGATEMTGRELTDKGLAIAISSQPGSVVLTYKKKAN